MPAPRPLEVVESGDRCRYLVRSEANPRAVYLVDLLSHGGIGECTCKNWQCERWPRVKMGERTYCKHGKAAREYFLNQVLAAMAQAEEPKKPCSLTNCAR